VTALKQNPLQAIGMMMFAVFLFSTMDVVLKMLVEDYSSFQVTFFRCAMSLPFFLGWILATGKSQFKTAYPAAHLFRAVLGLGMLWAVGECFREMQLADAYALFFASPLLITLLSGPVLGEPAGTFRIIASLVGFSGVLIVLSPSGGEWVSYGAVMGMISVILYSFSALLLRRLGHKDGTVTISFWFVFLIGIGAGLFSISSWRPIDPEHWPLLIIMGITGAGGQVLLTAAFRRASAAIVAPFDYAHMIWAVIYGYIFWGYLPGKQTWIGSSILILSGLFIIYRERRVMRRQTVVIDGM
jgi:drug/metabolite transporter (DMT)-like permease